MKKELLDYIRTLSKDDKKSLTQKALKTTEEVGELAKAILPFENAAGTLHRFSDRDKILEGVVDVFLTSISIAYELEFTDEEIEKMILDKSKKWSGIQAKENKVKFPLPYEIHVTIERPENIGEFKNYCQSIGVKPIIIDLEKDGESIMLDVMTSSVHYGDNRSAYEAAGDIERELTRPHEYFPNEDDLTIDLVSYKVLRTKIETVPWHPAAPSMEDDKNNGFPENSYFESHLRVVTTEDRKEKLQEIVDKFDDAHLSRNYFKKLNNGEYIIMVTIRSDSDAYEFFKMRVDVIKSELEIEDFVIDKVEIEFALYDTKVLHDQAWIGK